jgi:hypothetical protein
MARVRVPRTGVTQKELADVLGRRLNDDFEVGTGDPDEVIVRKPPLSAATIRIGRAPGATVFKVHGVGFPVLSQLTARAVADAIRRSPELRSI